MRDDRELSLQDYLTVLSRRWRLIVVTTVVLALTGFLWSSSQTRVYSARAQVLVDYETSARLVDPTGQLRVTGDRWRLLENEVSFARSALVYQEVTRRVGGDANASISSTGDADLISFSASDLDPAQAALVANVFAETYRDLRAERELENFMQARNGVERIITRIRGELAALEARTDEQANAERDALQAQLRTYEAQANTIQIGADLGGGGVRIINPAEEPAGPVSPQPVRSTALALVVGLIVGTGAAFLREYLDDTVRTKEDLESLASSVVLLGMVPRDREAAGAGAERVRFDDHGKLSEAFRSLRTSVQFVGLRTPLHSIQVTSANPAEGKTTIASNLAVSLAQGGTLVALVDADLRNPQLHRRFGLPGNDVGLSNVMLGQTHLLGALHSVEGCSNLVVLPSGPTPGNPADFLWPATAPEGSTTLAELLGVLRDGGFTVIVDSPPVLPVADALTISRAVDGTMFVASSNVSSSRDIVRALELLDQADARLAGTVLNNLTDERSTYGYGYGYGYRPDEPRRRLARLLPGGRRRRSTPTPDHARVLRQAHQPEPAAAAPAPAPAPAPAAAAPAPAPTATATRDDPPAPTTTPATEPDLVIELRDHLGLDPASPRATNGSHGPPKASNPTGPPSG